MNNLNLMSWNRTYFKINMWGWSCYAFCKIHPQNVLIFPAHIYATLNKRKMCTPTTPLKKMLILTKLPISCTILAQSGPGCFFFFVISRRIPGKFQINTAWHYRTTPPFPLPPTPPCVKKGAAKNGWPLPIIRPHLNIWARPGRPADSGSQNLTKCPPKKSMKKKKTVALQKSIHYFRPPQPPPRGIETESGRAN